MGTVLLLGPPPRPTYPVTRIGIEVLTRQVAVKQRDGVELPEQLRCR